MWSFNVKKDKVIAQNNDMFLIFERVSQSTRRTKEETFIYSKTLTHCTSKRIPSIVDWQGCNSNVVFMQGYIDADDSYHVKKLLQKSNKRVQHQRGGG